MIRSVTASLLSLTFLFSFTSVIHARDIYVSPTGTGDGTASDPSSIEAANSSAQPGDTIILTNGTYSQQIKPTRSGLPDAPITYKAQNSRQATIFGNNGTNAPTILIDNVDHIVIEGIVTDVDRLVRDTQTIDGLRRANNIDFAGIRIDKGSDYITIDDVDVSGGAYGIYIDAYLAQNRNQPIITNITIRNSEIHHNYKMCVFLLGNIEYALIENNNIHNCDNPYATSDHAWKTEAFAFGIEVNGGHRTSTADGPKFVKIYRNEIHHNGVQGIRSAHMSHLHIANNYIHHNGATGYQLEHQTVNAVIEYNRFEKNSQRFPFETGSWLGGGKNVLYQHNIVTGNMMGVYVNGLKLSGSQSDDPVEPAEHTIVRRNLIFSNNAQPTETNVPERPAQNAMGLRITDIVNSGIYHNTLYDNGVSGQSLFGDISYVPTANDFNSQNSMVINNISAQSNTSFDSIVRDTSVRQINSDYNLFYNTKRDSAFKFLNANLGLAEYRTQAAKEQHSLIANPGFTDPDQSNFQISPDSPARNAGTPLATATNSGNQSDILQVDRAYMFSDGFGLIAGDQISIGSHRAQIKSIDYASDTITLVSPASWSIGAAVNQAYVTDTTPDIGAVEQGSDIQFGIQNTAPQPTPTVTPAANPTATPTVPAPQTLTVLDWLTSFLTDRLPLTSIRY